MKKIYYLQPEPFDQFLTDAETIQLLKLFCKN